MFFFCSSFFFDDDDDDDDDDSDSDSDSDSDDDDDALGATVLLLCAPARQKASPNALVLGVRQTKRYVVAVRRKK